MLFSPTNHAVLLILGVFAIPVAGRLLARGNSGATLLLWLIPVALTASLADLALTAVDQVRPGTAFHAGDGGVVRFGLALLVTLPPVEIFYQRIVTRLAGGGPHTASPSAPDEDATPTDPADPEDADGG